MFVYLLLKEKYKEHLQTYVCEFGLNKCQTCWYNMVFLMTLSPGRQYVCFCPYQQLYLLLMLFKNAIKTLKRPPEEVSNHSQNNTQTLRNNPHLTNTNRGRLCNLKMSLYHSHCLCSILQLSLVL